MKERIQKILSSRGITSRRNAETMIQEGRVTCNGQICRIGDTADPLIDEIMVDGVIIPGPSEHTYIMLHKPRGYVTTLSDEKGRPNAAQLIADCGKRVYPVGRLDMDSEGLLIFTDDGELANRLMHPKHNVDKTYLVTVRGFAASGLERLQKPIVLDGYTLRIPEVRVLETDLPGDKTRLEITIHEGRNRQVRRMCKVAKMQVIRLIRIAEGPLQLGKLPSGGWRYLTESEIFELKK